ncbi:HIF1A [Bugula neritina]|uniref:HIF1A n=1 Tax=Bugula neritina TaxID=10212 RepID=A0A7J7KIK9_BUGNE|nr:HIF1A [Bugula neritina]
MISTFNLAKLANNDTGNVRPANICEKAGVEMAQVKKAEKSRVHAKQRRTDESKEICEIADLLPLPRNVTKRLDKASILRLAITFLKLRNYIGSDKDAFEELNSDIGEGT